MGYIIGFLILLLVVPLLFLVLSRRTTGGGGAGAKWRDRGVTVMRPSAEEPTPRAGTLNQPKPGTEERMG